MHCRPLIFVVISVLVIGTLGLSYSTGAIAVPPVGGADCKSREAGPGITYYRCCWTETEEGDPEQIEIYMCQECTVVHGEVDCQNPFPDPSAAPTTGEEISPGVTGGLEQTPTPPPFDPAAPQQGGVFEQQEQQEPPTPPTFAPGTSPGVLEQLEQQTPPPPPFVPGFLERQQLQPPTTTEETQPATVEEAPPVPVCQEGLEFNEDLGFCVPEDCPDGQVLDEESGICVLEEPEAAEEPAEPQLEEEQPSEESDQGDGGNN